MLESFLRESYNWVKHSRTNFQRAMVIPFRRERDAVARPLGCLDRFVKRAATSQVNIALVLPTESLISTCARSSSVGLLKFVWEVMHRETKVVQLLLHLMGMAGVQCMGILNIENRVALTVSHETRAL